MTETRVLFHIADPRDWADATVSGRYRMSTRGATLDRVGFVHASHDDQVERVAAVVYADETAPLVVLEIDPDALAAAGIEVRLEPGDPTDPDGERFPHIYGAVPVTAVTAVVPARMVDGRLVRD